MLNRCPKFEDGRGREYADSPFGADPEMDAGWIEPSRAAATMSVDPLLYETQFFGFTPQTCVLRVYIAFQDCLFEVMAAVEKVIVRKAGRGLSAAQVRGGTEAFLRFLRGRFTRLFVRMERALLQLVLSVPPNVLLPEDRSHRQGPGSREDLGPLRRRVEQLRRRYKAELGARRALLAELEAQKVVRARLEKTLRGLEAPGGLAEAVALVARLRGVAEDVARRSRVAVPPEASPAR